MHYYGARSGSGVIGDIPFHVGDHNHPDHAYILDKGGARSYLKDPAEKPRP